MYSSSVFFHPTPEPGRAVSLAFLRVAPKHLSGVDARVYLPCVVCMLTYSERKEHTPFALPRHPCRAMHCNAMRCDGMLLYQDLESVQKLLLEKTSKREEEGVLLFDAAQVVAQRRRGAVRGGGGAGFSPGMGKLGASVAAAASAGESGGGGEFDEDEQPEDGVESSADRPRRVRKFEHTGWFHSYE